jgi:hypothetical protein
MHAVKFQVIINAKTKEIISIHESLGKNHDFQIFKNSKIKFLSETIVLADSGYQGLQKIHANTFLPFKNSKNKKINDFKKNFNKLLRKIRVSIEHVFAKLKRFKIIGYKCRKNKKRLKLYFHLIAGIYNLTLTLN